MLPFCFCPSGGSLCPLGMGKFDGLVSSGNV
jgi:hypothetical protein